MKNLNIQSKGLELLKVKGKGGYPWGNTVLFRFWYFAFSISDLDQKLSTVRYKGEGWGPLGKQRSLSVLVFWVCIFYLV